LVRPIERKEGLTKPCRRSGFRDLEPFGLPALSKKMEEQAGRGSDTDPLTREEAVNVYES